MSVVLNGGTDGLEGIKPEDYIGYEIENTKTGLRLLEERETKLALLRRALTEGEESGTADYNLKSLNAELDSEIFN